MCRESRLQFTKAEIENTFHFIFTITNSRQKKSGKRCIVGDTRRARAFVTFELNKLRMDI